MTPLNLTSWNPYWTLPQSGQDISNRRHIIFGASLILMDSVYRHMCGLIRKESL